MEEITRTATNDLIFSNFERKLSFRATYEQPWTTLNANKVEYGKMLNEMVTPQTTVNNVKM